MQHTIVRRQMEKLRLSSIYGKCASPDELTISQAGGDGEPDHRTKEFTMTELFGNQIGAKIHGELVKKCMECGSLVAGSYKHVEWHNKLLP